MLYFLDTSALAKRYLPEAGSLWVFSLLEGAGDSVTISAITSVELSSALARRCRTGEISPEQRDTQYRQFVADSSVLEIIEVTEGIMSEASRLLFALPVGLRSLDAIQLATLLRWSEQLKANNIEPGTFVVADSALRDAAVALGLPVDNPEEHE